MVKRSGGWPVPLPAHRATTPRYLLLWVHRISFLDEPLEDLVDKARQGYPPLLDGGSSLLDQKQAGDHLGDGTPRRVNMESGSLKRRQVDLW